MRRFFAVIFILLAGIFQVSAQQDSVLQAKADSINKAAISPDFIEAFLVYAHPGNQIYSVQGHSLLRLVSKSNDLDIIYTFETGETADDIFRFFRGNAKAGFVYAPTDVVLADYRKDGRMVEQIQLNLTPQQEQQLWKYLDEQMASHTMYRYDYLSTNCSTMLINAVETALAPESIEYRNLPAAMQGGWGAYREGLNESSMVGEWQRLFWQLSLGLYADKEATLNQKLVPYYLWHTWQKALVKQADGSTRRLTTGRTSTILKGEEIFSQSPITPLHISIMLLVVSLITLWSGTAVWVGRMMDVVLMSIETIFGLWLFFLSPIIGTISTGWNIMLGLFNPLPILLWLTLHKKRQMRYIYLLFAIVSAAYLLGTLLIPQMQVLPCLPLLAACFFVRTTVLLRR